MKNKIRYIVLNLLARREHSHYELRQKLIRKQYPAAEIDLVLAEFGAANLISDARFTENYINWRCKRGLGPQRIMQELQIRGIAKELIHQFLNASDPIWLETLQQLWNRRWKNKASKKRDKKELYKQLRYIQSRGFTADQIKQINQVDEHL